MVGLTGSIASGKSLVAGHLIELGVPLVDADILAREIVEPGEPAWEDIRERFGEEVLNADQTLNRGALGALIFADEDARRALETITHPRIAQRLMQYAQQYRMDGERWMVYDAALLVENNAHRWLNALIVVAVDPQVQLERLMQRDGLSTEAAQQRIDSQMPVQEKIKVADYVIDNNGTRDQTRAQVDEIFKQLMQRFNK
ncbi:dephospho-CoA kinase [Bradymonas sediminis]|uniref:Dephospho-CoA kinase n=2 Tax=Bradymonas sediminis TaxID=1548548 RepID=A0A2Z4FQZ8_9DELT|nr:dephospho-CoA kinase [Bradymonas sediminis]